MVAFVTSFMIFVGHICKRSKTSFHQRISILTVQRFIKMNYLFIVFVLLPTLSPCSCENNLKLKRDGNVVSIIFLPISSMPPADSLILMEAILYAMNYDNANIYTWQKESHNANFSISFGYIIYDSEKNETSHKNLVSALTDLASEFKYTNNKVNLTSKDSCSCRAEKEKIILGFAGNFTSMSTLFSANAILPYYHPLVDIAPHSMKLDPRIYFQYHQATSYSSSMLTFIMKLIGHYGWKYIGIIGSNDMYGKAGKEVLLHKLQEIDTCIAFIEIFPMDKRSNKVLMHKIKNDQFLDVIILWVTTDIGKMFLSLANEENVYNRTWVIGPSMYPIPTEFLGSLSSHVTHGMIFFVDYSVATSLLESKSTQVYAGFGEYFWSLKYNETLKKPWLRHFFRINNATSNSNSTIGDFKNQFPHDLLLMTVGLLKTLKTFSYFVRRALDFNPNITEPEFQYQVHLMSMLFTGKFFFYPHFFVLQFQRAFIINATSKKLLLPNYHIVGNLVSVVSLESLKYTNHLEQFGLVEKQNHRLDDVHQFVCLVITLFLSLLAAGLVLHAKQILLKMVP